MRLSFVWKPASDCERARQRLSEYLDGVLSASDQEWVNAHLAGCAGCRDELAQLQLTVSLLRSLPQVPVPRPFLVVAPERQRSGLFAALTPATLSRATAAVAVLFAMVLSASVVLQGVGMAAQSGAPRPPTSAGARASTPTPAPAAKPALAVPAAQPAEAPKPAAPRALESSRPEASQPGTAADAYQSAGQLKAEAGPTEAPQPTAAPRPTAALRAAPAAAPTRPAEVPVAAPAAPAAALAATPIAGAAPAQPPAPQATPPSATPAPAATAAPALAAVSTPTVSATSQPLAGKALPSEEAALPQKAAEDDSASAADTQRVEEPAPVGDEASREARPAEGEDGLGRALRLATIGLGALVAVMALATGATWLNERRRRSRSSGGR